MADLTTNKIPKATGATQIDDSNYADHGDGSLTVDISDAGIVIGSAGLSVKRDIFGGIAVQPESTVGGTFIEIDAVGVLNYPILFFAFAEGTIGELTATQSGDRLFSLEVCGHGTSEFGTLSVNIWAEASGNFADNQHPTTLHIGTTKAGVAETLEDRIVVDDDGDTSVLNGVLIVESHAPAAADSDGKAGTITWDSDFLYVCVATGTWKRVAIATW